MLHQMHTIVIPLVGLWFLGLLSKTLVAPSSVTLARTLDWDRGFTHPHRDLVSSLRRGENSHVRTQTCCWWLFSVWRPTLSFGKSEISKLLRKSLVALPIQKEGFQSKGLTGTRFHFPRHLPITREPAHKSRRVGHQNFVFPSRIRNGVPIFTPQISCSGALSSTFL